MDESYRTLSLLHFINLAVVLVVWVICDVNFSWWWLTITFPWDVIPCSLAEKLLMFWRNFWLPSSG